MEIDERVVFSQAFFDEVHANASVGNRNEKKTQSLQFDNDKMLMLIEHSCDTRKKVNCTRFGAFKTIELAKLTMQSIVNKNHTGFRVVYTRRRQDKFLLSFLFFFFFVK